MFGQGSLQASDAIELSGLCDSERSRALAQFEIIRLFFEDGVPLTQLAREQQIVLRTARRWVERYREKRPYAFNVWKQVDPVLRSPIFIWSYGKDPPCMPVYEYFCKNCDENFTVTMTIAEHDKKNVKCPKCKGKKVVPQFRSFYAKTSRKS
jgi:putative FmdB family regulatory protein